MRSICIANHPLAVAGAMCISYLTADPHAPRVG
jgi:hypothetical protein